MSLNIQDKGDLSYVIISLNHKLLRSLTHFVCFTKIQTKLRNIYCSHKFKKYLNTLKLHFAESILGQHIHLPPPFGDGLHEEVSPSSCISSGQGGGTSKSKTLLSLIKIHMRYQTLSQTCFFL